MQGVDVQELVKALGDNPYLRRCHVWCELRGDCVVLLGSVGTFFQKQMAQETLRPWTRQLRIDNRIAVTSPSTRQGQRDQGQRPQSTHAAAPHSNRRAREHQNTLIGCGSVAARNSEVLESRAP